ncbi:type II toxin-antitoxin system PemK/MazF family toxin [Streptomyces sp. Wb2n-11]|uniref:type II toxin-antitoxin system PemK/MazF family toxin n=1 Tax=Streptomyces sp. Wb2n-11 TaxID=1030533 RepID=UPI000B897388|nr:type II toxin-antitoxin system PemK/MazF family toxin [Streptomyces sp. Wb2n-11]
MDTSWWVALVAVVVLALVAALVDGRGRGRRPGGRTRGRSGGRADERTNGRAEGRTRPPKGPRGPRGPGRSGPERAPRAGEIWWADVPYEDGPGSKDRPCLVLSVRGDSALIAKITSKFHDERPGVIALPPGSVGDARGRPSFLETDELRDVGVRGFRRRVGVADPGVWEQVRHLAR